MQPRGKADVLSTLEQGMYVGEKGPKGCESRIEVRRIKGSKEQRGGES